MGPLISIIMPAYNCEKTVSETIMSICAQNFCNYEFIIVNDGSTDQTLTIINSFAEQFSQIKIFNIENSGPSNARNIGIQHSDGQYLMFIDSDDTLKSDALVYIASLLKSNNLDMLIFGFDIINVAQKKTYSYSFDDLLINGQANVSPYFSDLYFSNLLNQAWNKVYKSDLIKSNNISFPLYNYGEDRLFVLTVLPKCSSIQISKKCLYNYYSRTGESLVTKFYSKKFEVCNLIQTTIDELILYYRIDDQKSLSNFRYMYLKSILSCITNLYLPSCNYSSREKKREVQNILNNCYFQEQLQSCDKSNQIMAFIVFFLKSKNVFLISTLAKFILFVSHFFPSIFIASKHPTAKISNEN